jgi:hypothetical protein
MMMLIDPAVPFSEPVPGCPLVNGKPSRIL